MTISSNDPSSSRFFETNFAFDFKNLTNCTISFGPNPNAPIDLRTILRPNFSLKIHPRQNFQDMSLSVKCRTNDFELYFSEDEYHSSLDLQCSCVSDVTSGDYLWVETGNLSTFGAFYLSLGIAQTSIILVDAADFQPNSRRAFRLTF